MAHDFNNNVEEIKESVSKSDSAVLLLELAGDTNDVIHDFESVVEQLTGTEPLAARTVLAVEFNQHDSAERLAALNTATTVRVAQVEPSTDEKRGTVLGEKEGDGSRGPDEVLLSLVMSADEDMFGGERNGGGGKLPDE